MFVQDARDFGTGTTDQGILFDADQQRMFPRQFNNQLAVDRFDEAHVGHGGIEFFAGFQRRCQHAAEGQQGDVLAAAADFALADRQRSRVASARQRPVPLPRG